MTTVSDDSFKWKCKCGQGIYLTLSDSGVDRRYQLAARHRGTIVTRVDVDALGTPKQMAQVIVGNVNWFIKTHEGFDTLCEWVCEWGA